MPDNTKNLRLQAALELAKNGYKVFPVPPGKKQSYIAQRSRFGSGEAWGMTNDPELINRYWKRWPKANIGLPTGVVNGIIVIETDSPKGHATLEADGEVSLQAVEKRLGALPATRMAESPSGSKHRLYAHPGGRVKNSASQLGPGIDVRGDGGMIVAPPSERKDGAYRWLNQHAIVALSKTWVAELVIERDELPRRELPADANWAEQYGAEQDGLPELKEVEVELDKISNDNVGWEVWNDVGMRIFAATGGSDDGLRLFDEWSRKAPKRYDRSNTKKKWRLFQRSPPTRYTSNSIFNLGNDDESQPEESVSWQQENKNKKSEEDEPPGDVNGHVSAAALSVGDAGKHIVVPHNFWDEYATPDLIPGLFPATIEKLATVLSDVRGSDPAGLAMGGLLACGAAIPDCYRIQPKPRSDPGWMLAARIWVTMVGGVASIKTSTVDSITEPFKQINDEMFDEYKRALARYNALEPAEKKEAEEPHPRRILISDSTSQGAQDIMHYNEDGLLNVQDELGHFYGSLDQFTRGGNSGSERFFWAKTFEGGSYLVDRANKQRKFAIKNCGMSLFGGIQPEVIRHYGDKSANDGLLQRSLFVMLKKAVLDRDIPSPPVQEEYNDLIRKLHLLPRDKSAVVNFTAEASDIRQSFFEETLNMSDVYGSWNGKLGEHISKWRGLFCRICLLIHIVENIDEPLECNIDASVAERVRRLFLDYLLLHSEAFYLGVLSSAGETSKLEAVASFILAHDCKEISGRDLKSMVRATRELTSKDVDQVFQQMFYLSWITPKEKKRSDSTKWDVNPLVHQLYRAQAEITRRQNEVIRDKILERKANKAKLLMGRRR